MGENRQQDVQFLTWVRWVPGSELGALGSRWHVVHACVLCSARVTAPDLVDHARTHLAAHD